MFFKRPQIILAILILLFISYFTFLSFARHDNFYSRRIDLGNMDQTVWNVINGNGFTLTSEKGNQQISRLAVHADFLLILLAPFYLLWSNPKMLLLIQAIVLGLGALPIYWFALEKIKSKNLALIFPLAYLLYPPIQRVALHDFHAVVLSATFLLFSFWYMHKEKYALFVIFALLSALGKEQMWIITGLFGLYILFIKKNIWIGLLATSVSFGFFYLLISKFIPAATPNNQHFALTYLSEFGTDQNSIIKNIITNPPAVIRNIISPDRFYYYLQLLSPVSLLSLLSPLKMVFAVPDILINTLSNNHLMRQIDYQYTSGIYPFIFISAIEGFALLKKIRISALIFLIVLIFSSYLWGELPFTKNSRYKTFTTKKPENEIMQKFAGISAKYSVSATNNIGAHFSQRKLLYNYPVMAEDADFVFIDLSDYYAWPSQEEQKKVLNKLLENNNYKLIAHKGNFYAFQKNN